MIKSPDWMASLDNEQWEFYILGVWKREDGLYMATDSGCSCPDYWENMTESDLTGPLTFEQVAEESRSLAQVARWRGAVVKVEEMLTDIEKEEK